MTEKITDIRGEEIKDSTGRPTLRITVSAGEHVAEAQVPSGQSRGSREAFELRDEDGGMDKALALLETEIKPALVGQEVDRRKIDEMLIALDGTPDKSRLGGNTLIGISVATARLAALLGGEPLWQNLAREAGGKPGLPALFMNIINGGVHADFRLPFQEYMIVVEDDSAEVSYQTGKKIFDKLGEITERKYGQVPFGDEGGYSPVCQRLEETFELLAEASAGESVYLAIDAAASEFYRSDAYEVLGQKYSAEGLLELYKNLTKEFLLRSIEDPFEENDTESFGKITAELGEEVSIVGDDLTVTNPKRINELSLTRAANAVIIKPNQIGTITETLEAIRLAHKAGWQTIVSHRSGDTMDSFIADLAVGTGAYGIKTGSPEPAERRVKYDRLVAIEQEMLR